MKKSLLLFALALGIAVGIGFQRNLRNAESVGGPTDTPNAHAQLGQDEQTAKPKSGELDQAVPTEQTWPDEIEAARKIVLNPASSVAQKAQAIAALRDTSSADFADPRTVAILDEAVWILSNAPESAILEDTLRGMEGVQYAALIEPAITCLLNDTSAAVRLNAAQVLKVYADNERVQIALDHAAEYDPSEHVRDAANARP